jgi:hypothetical protein
LLDEIVLHCFDSARASKLWGDLDIFINNINARGKFFDEIQHNCLRLLVSLSKCVDDGFFSEKKDFGELLLRLTEQRLDAVFKVKQTSDESASENSEEENPILIVRSFFNPSLFLTFPTLYCLV